MSIKMSPVPLKQIFRNHLSDKLWILLKSEVFFLAYECGGPGTKHKSQMRFHYVWPWEKPKNHGKFHNEC